MKTTAKRLAALLLTALLLTACAKTPAQPEKSAGEAGAPQAEQPAAEETPLEVENNGGYYVRVNDKVYFRRYGADALPKTALFGEFADMWGASGGECELMAYAPAAGELETVCVENGTGPLWYGDGGFYLRERIDGRDYVGWYALDGFDGQTLCPGVPLGVTEGGLFAVQRMEYDSAWQMVYTFTFYRGKEVVGETELVSPAERSVAGLTDKGLFLIGRSGEADGDAVCVWQVTPEGKLFNLGALPETEEDPSYYGMQADRFLDLGDRVVLGVGYYAGTGHFLNESQFVEATPETENSVRALDGEAEGEEMPYPALNADGTVEFVPALPGQLRVGWQEENSGALERYEDGAWKTLYKDFCPAVTDGFGYRRIEQHLESVGGAVYATVACAHASPMDSVGWRDAYALLDMLYVAVDGSGALRELDCVDHETELYGDVWFIEGESTALWRQRAAGDGEEDDLPWYAYAIPIAEDAYWEGGWEAVFNGATGLVDGYDTGEAGCDGYPVPESEPAGQLCLTLDRDGTVVALARRAPDELLAIDFDVAESELSGAAKRLDPAPRPEDEDTAWYWTKLRALEDGVRVRVERTTEESLGDVAGLAMLEGEFIPGETLYDGVLNRGEFVALRASLPWHPEMRVSVSKDGAWGGYVFGEDNWMHLWTEDSVHPEKRIAAPAPRDMNDYTGEALCRSLAGAWFYRSPLSGEIAAKLWIDEDGTISISDDESYCELAWDFGSLYAADCETPDLLCLQTDDEYAAGRIGFGGSVGDYLIGLYRTDGEEILRLEQANNGDGALQYLLPDALDENLFAYTLTRARGADETGARRRAGAFEALAVRFDRERKLVWLREAEIVDELEDGSPIRRAVRTAPCLPYEVKSQDALDYLTGGREQEHPFVVCAVTTDREGCVTALGPVADQAP